MLFRNALPEEADKLTRLALESKGYWGYPEEWMNIWTDELTVSSEYINNNMVVLAEEDSELLGFISIVEYSSKHMITCNEYNISGGFFIDNLFVQPSHIQRGIGKGLMAVSFNWCIAKNIEKLYVYSDPNAKGFYEKMGALFLGEVVSGKLGRSLPFLVFEFLHQIINENANDLNDNTMAPL